MTHRGPFQPLPFCDSVINAFPCTVHHEQLCDFLQLFYLFFFNLRMTFFVTCDSHVSVGYWKTHAGWAGLFI